MAGKFKIPQFDVSLIKDFDWRSFKRVADPQAADKLNRFLEKMPVNAGNTMLIIAAIVWSVAGAVGLGVTVKLQKFTDMRAELHEAEALQPLVPIIKETPISAAEVTKFIERTKNIYRNVDIKQGGATLTLTAKSTGDFAQWREAIGHVQNGGSGWRVNIDSLCVGRECGKVPLSAVLKINKVEVKAPSF